MDACSCTLPAFHRGDPTKGTAESLPLDKARIAIHNGPLWCRHCFKFVPSDYFQGNGPARAAFEALRPTPAPGTFRRVMELANGSRIATG